jgi:hypothetical protein
MTNSIASDQIPQSEKEVRKHSSRFSAGYWVDRLFRPTYVRDGETFQVAEWYAQIQYGGKRQKVGLASNDKEAASRKAAKLYQDIRTKGWTEALKPFAPERNDSKNRSTVGGPIELVTPLLRVRPVSIPQAANSATGASRPRRRFMPITTGAHLSQSGKCRGLERRDLQKNPRRENA